MTSRTTFIAVTIVNDAFLDAATHLRWDSEGLTSYNDEECFYVDAIRRCRPRGAPVKRYLSETSVSGFDKSRQLGLKDTHRVAAK